MMKKYLGISYVSSFFALGVASCCVLPMVMILFGIGGSWLAIFGKVSAFSLAMLFIASLALIVAWVVAFRRQTVWNLASWLVGSSILTMIAWALYLNETAINERIMNWM